jgi:hypothetical protein
VAEDVPEAELPEGSALTEARPQGAPEPDEELGFPEVRRADDEP